MNTKTLVLAASGILVLLAGPLGFDAARPAAAQLPPGLNEFKLPLTWVGRSTESAGGVASSPVLAGAVAAGLNLPLDPNQAVFDDGTFTDPTWLAGVGPGIHWASWLKWNSGCALGFETHHFRATFDFPLDASPAPGVGPVGRPLFKDLVLYSPFYTNQPQFGGKIIPINDNVYVFLNGVQVAQRGTSYPGAIFLGPVPGQGPYANEVGTWIASGSLGGDATKQLKVGRNQLDLVGEDWCVSGGMGQLDLKVVLV